MAKIVTNSMDLPHFEQIHYYLVFIFNSWNRNSDNLKHVFVVCETTLQSNLCSKPLEKISQIVDKDQHYPNLNSETNTSTIDYSFPVIENWHFLWSVVVESNTAFEVNQTKTKTW